MCRFNVAAAAEEKLRLRNSFGHAASEFGRDGDVGAAGHDQRGRLDAVQIIEPVLPFADAHLIGEAGSGLRVRMGRRRGER